MRLLQIDNETGDEFSLVEFIGDTPRYAILSHTWGPNGTEVTYKDLVEGTGKDKAGYKKIRACSRQSAKAKYKYFWVDTCCIDKTSSAELSEAINSMYRWYEEAGVCFAYIEDASSSLPISEWTISNIRWFTRGWTLQELLAPQEVEFFDTDWSALGTRNEHARLLSKITSIDFRSLERCHFYGESFPGYNKSGRVDLRFFSIASKMSWAAERTTKRPEDVAYCLLGIFDVNMPLLYGEGSTKAFVRLQEEIMKGSNDQSLFAWCRPNASPEASGPHGLLAESPLDFSGSGSVGHSMLGFNNPYAMTNKGLHITLPMAKLEGNYHVALLHCMISQDHVAIVLKEFPGDRYFRVALNSLKFQESISSLPLLKWDATRKLCCSSKTIYVPNVLPLVEFMDFALEEYPQISIYGSSAKVVSYHYDNFSVHY
jgi:hypothetical protein